MKSFATHRQKRGGDNALNIYHGSPSKKKAVENLVKVYQLDPYTLGAYFIKEDGTSPYYWPLYKGLETNKQWCQDLNIGMTVRRRAIGGTPGETMKVKTKNGHMNWYMFLRFLEQDEIKKSKKIGEAWGKNLAATMSKYFFRVNQMEKSTYQADRFVFDHMLSTVEKLSDHAVQHDIVAVAKVIFRDSILSKDFFKNKELMELLFPNVPLPENLFFKM